MNIASEIVLTVNPEPLVEARENLWVKCVVMSGTERSRETGEAGDHSDCLPNTIAICYTTDTVEILAIRIHFQCIQYVLNENRYHVIIGIIIITIIVRIMIIGLIIIISSVSVSVRKRKQVIIGVLTSSPRTFDAANSR